MSAAPRGESESEDAPQSPVTCWLCRLLILIVGCIAAAFLQRKLLVFCRTRGHEVASGEQIPEPPKIQVTMPRERDRHETKSPSVHSKYELLKLFIAIVAWVVLTPPLVACLLAGLSTPSSPVRQWAVVNDLAMSLSDLSPGQAVLFNTGLTIAVIVNLWLYRRIVLWLVASLREFNEDTHTTNNST